MIRVVVNENDISADWLAKADRLTRKLRECVDDDEEVPIDRRRTAKQKRDKLIEDNSLLWAELKPILLKWSHNKCWYSELRDDGSDYHVDHFRPKGRVRDAGTPDREGYWWLAFDWRNFRLSVAWCNSQHKSVDGPARGKADHFPLAPGATPLTEHDDNLDYEDVVLLDPVKESDVILIDFDETGLPTPASGGWSAKRVMMTRNILHLDAPRMVEARQKAWRECEKKLLMAAGALNVTEGEYRSRDAKTAEAWIAEVCEMLRPDAPLSAVAQACVTKSRYPWARRLLSHPHAQISVTS